MEQDEYLKCQMDDIEIWIYFTEVMLPKFCTDMLQD